MMAALTVFAYDRSQRWILVPGVASTRQVEIRNETDSPVEVHLRVEEPAAASPSPALMTIEPGHSRVADIIFLASWSPMHDHHATISLRNAHDIQIASFSQEIVAADSADCSLSIELKDDVLVDKAMIALKLWCTVASRSSTPRRFEIDFTPHPALRFPDRMIVTLAPGEASAFEVPVQWNRSVRDGQGWNHPRAVETFVPVSDGRRTASVSWEQIEQRLASYLSGDDREAKVVAAQPLDPPRPSFLEKTPGQLKYEEFIDLKRLEQGVVAPPARALARAGDASSDPPGSRRLPLAPLVTIGFALGALVLAGFFFLRPPEKQISGGPMSVSPLKLSPAPTAHATTNRNAAAAAANTHPARALRATTSGTLQPKTGITPAASALGGPGPSVAAAPPRPKPLPTIDRSQIVALSSVAAAYAHGGRSVSVAWNGAAQAGALVQLVDFTGKVIASRSIRGPLTDTMLQLPRGYHGSVSVNVTAFGYHGERVVQTASL